MIRYDIISISHSNSDHVWIMTEGWLISHHGFCGEVNSNSVLSWDEVEEGQAFEQEGESSEEETMVSIYINIA